MSTSDHELIRNVIARCVVAIDRGQFDELDKVFTEDAPINFKFVPQGGGERRGVQAIKELIQSGVAKTSSNHALTTQTIELTSPTTAKALSYVTVIHVGNRDHRFPGEVLYSWGYYEDRLIKGTFDGREDWRVSERIVDTNIPNMGKLDLMSPDKPFTGKRI